MNCVHHWLLETPMPGVELIKQECKKCGEVKHVHPFATEQAIFNERVTAGERGVAARKAAFERGELIAMGRHGWRRAQ